MYLLLQHTLMYMYLLLQHTLSFSSTASSSYHGEAGDGGSLPRTTAELFNIASLQSSARPGCVLEMEAISDAQQVAPHS